MGTKRLSSETQGAKENLTHALTVSLGMASYIKAVSWACPFLLCRVGGSLNKVGGL